MVGFCKVRGVLIVATLFFWQHFQPIPQAIAQRSPSQKKINSPIYDSNGCPVALTPGKNINHKPQQFVDRERLQINFGIQPPGIYICRADQVTPYKVDPTDQAESSMTEPLRDHLYRLGTITTQSERFLTHNQEPAKCALDWIVPWAQAGIFTEKAGTLTEGGAHLARQGDYERVFYISNFAVAYGLIKNESGLDLAKKQSVEAWLLKAAQEIDRFTALRLNKDKDPENNIINWSALSLMSVGLVLQNKTLQNRALQLYDRALSQIRNDGLLPLELARGDRAFWYHNYALEPLIYMAEISETFGLNLYARDKGRLHLLAKRMIEGFEDFSTFPNHQTQTTISTPRYLLTEDNRELSWMEIYYSRFADPRLKKILQTARQSNNGSLKISLRTHGSSTHLFGVKCL